MKNDATEPALGLLNLDEAATSSSTVPSKRAAPQDDDQAHASTSDSINCICGYSFDDGFSIACDDCSRWCHAACFEIVQGGVPEEWKCWVCAPRPVDRERAVRLQTQRRQDALRADNEKRRRQTSPSVERKHRRQSALAIEGGNSRRKRRPSVNVQPVGEDEHVNVDEPWTHSYIPIFKDIVPHQETRDNLRRQAKHWRGVSALSHPPFPPGPLDNTPVVLSTPPSTSPTSIRPLPHSSFSHPVLSSHTNPSVRPPSYSMHTIQPILSSKLITPFTSTIIPSSAYLSDPLNAYAHHGMPKPFVHLFGPPLDVALDARITGNEARFVRSGCRPNAVLRPMICSPTKGTDQRDPSSSKCRDSETLTFGVFALRDIKANEEVVLGWEWDDGNAVHHLPALIEAPHMFQAHHLSYIRNQMASMLHALSSTFTTCACGSKAKDCALNLMAEFVDGRLPVAASPPSQRANDPSGTDLQSHRVDLGPLVGAQRGFHTREKSPLNGGMNGVEMIPGQPTGPSDQRATVDATGLVQKENYLLPDHIDGGVPKVKTAAASSLASPSPPATGNQVEEDRSQEVSDPPRTPDLSPSHPRHLLPDAAGHSTYRSSSPSDSDPQPQSEDEEQMPPKMRKRWIHRSMEGLPPVSPSVSPCGSNISLGSVLDEGQMEVDLVSSDTKDMPPPPMPANLDPTTVSSIPHSSSPRVLTSNLSSLSSAQTPDLLASPSPSTPFANLSLLSPTASYSSNSSPFSPKLSTLTSSFLSIASTLAFSPDADPPIQMDVDKDPYDSQSTRHPPLLNARSPSPQSLTSSEPLRRVQPPPMSRVDSPRPASPSRQTSSVPGPLPDAEPPPAPSSPRTDASSPPPSSLQATPKVKMSLKDFAMRKKKQREEEQARGAVPSDSFPPSGQSGACVDPPSSDAARDPNGSEQAARDVVAPRVAIDDAARSDCDVESTYPSSRPTFHAESEPSASTKVGIVSAASRPLPDPATNSTPVTNGVLQRLSRTASLPPSSSDSEDSEAGGTSTARTTPPTHPRSFSIGTTTTATAAAATSTGLASSSALPHRLPPSSTYRPGSSYVPPSIPVSVRPLPSGPRALRASLGMGVSTNGAVATTTPFASPVRGFPAAQFAGVPRGPSADRDRDRGWAGIVRGRGRGTTSSSSWGR
ncbi:hypothetical protein EDB86DRAFT_2008934 [Lactarius hatsudake]|nr:hypothetical protein EDB86DRAFT_2008934 [Lactarius hatsudake]